MFALSGLRDGGGLRGGYPSRPVEPDSGASNSSVRPGDNAQSRYVRSTSANLYAVGLSNGNSLFPERTIREEI